MMLKMRIWVSQLLLAISGFSLWEIKTVFVSIQAEFGGVSIANIV
jgi:hypothetical protein